MEDYEKLDVEDIYRTRGAIVCRLPAVFGPYDEQRREDFILRRVVAGRKQIPFGAGNWLWSRLHVQDAAVGLATVVEHHQMDNEVLNIGPATTLTVRQWAKAILTGAGATASLESVPDVALPGDLWLSASIGQHILADSSKAQALLNWRDRDPTEATIDSVAWHLDGYREGEVFDWNPDDVALASNVQRRPAAPKMRSVRRAPGMTPESRAGVRC